jgi:uncharacterized membrane protein HdeD (DUF308 family)
MRFLTDKLTLGIIAIVVGIIILIWPQVIAWVIGIVLIIYGILLLIGKR